LEPINKAHDLSRGVGLCVLALASEDSDEAIPVAEIYVYTFCTDTRKED
jgi:hypothetical protein